MELVGGGSVINGATPSNFHNGRNINVGKMGGCFSSMRIIIVINFFNNAMVVLSVVFISFPSQTV